MLSDGPWLEEEERSGGDGAGEAEGANAVSDDSPGPPVSQQQKTQRQEEGFRRGVLGDFLPLGAAMLMGTARGATVSPGRLLHW